MLWILILTISGAGTRHDGVAIHDIPAFESEVACEVAGEKWMSKLHESDQYRASWVCLTTGNQ